MYARGTHALGLCDVCGFEYKLRELKYTVNNGQRTNIRACRSCWTPDHPQNHVGKVNVVDYMQLQDPRPEGDPPDMRNIRWGWGPVYALEAQSAIGEVLVTVTS